ncbi:MAG: AAA family ATPase, partial [Bacteroidia bacterium]|nr:AAA family ATPase [Bacteroidia bacterium]
MNQELPIGISSFEKIREQNFIYVDKTELIYQLVKTYGSYFLSRPRRFGKSLLVDTIKNLFEGRKELFEGLAIYNHWNWEQKFPVIKLDFTSGEFKYSGKLLEKIFKILFDNYQYHQIPYTQSNNYNIDFQNLIQKTYAKYNQKVVIVVDEYDKPILDCIEDKNQAVEHRDILRDLYSVIKGSDEYLRFVILTGVSKFSKTSIFSGLNNLTDITMMKDFATICGYTHDELLNNFSIYLEQVDLDEVKRWYNGYCWHL